MDDFEFYVCTQVTLNEFYFEFPSFQIRPNNKADCWPNRKPVSGCLSSYVLQCTFCIVFDIRTSARTEGPEEQRKSTHVFGQNSKQVHLKIELNLFFFRSLDVVC